MSSVSGYTAPMFTITLQLPPQQNTPSSSERQAAVPQQITGKPYTDNAPGTASATFNYGTNRIPLSDRTYTPSTPSLNPTLSADKNTPASSVTANSSANSSAEVAKQSTTQSEILKTSIGGKSMTSASAYEKQIDDIHKNIDGYNKKLLDLRTKLAELGKGISHFLRTGYSNDSKEILNARAEFARIEQEVKICEEGLAKAKKEESTAIANRNNALDGVGRESTQAPSQFLQKIYNMLANMIAALFGMGSTQNKSPLDAIGNQNNSLLETVIGGGNHLAAQEYDRDIEKAKKQLSGYEKELGYTQDKKREIDTFISDSIRNKGVSEKDLNILEARERWDALTKTENELKERIATTQENIETFKTKRDALLNANVPDAAAAKMGNNLQAPNNPMMSYPFGFGFDAFSSSNPFASNPIGFVGNNSPMQSYGYDFTTDPFVIATSFPAQPNSTARF